MAWKKIMLRHGEAATVIHYSYKHAKTEELCKKAIVVVKKSDALEIYGSDGIIKIHGAQNVNYVKYCKEIAAQVELEKKNYDHYVLEAEAI